MSFSPHTARGSRAGLASARHPFRLPLPPRFNGRPSMTPPRSLPILALLASLALPACAATPQKHVTPIGKIEVDGARSALDGQTVTVEGIVTATFPGLGGFFVQDAGDGQATTSDALFVAFEEGVPAPAMASGDRVRVRGIVGERKAGGDDTLTALHAPVIQPRGTGHIAPTVLTALPAHWEPLEGMLVRIDAPLTLSGTHTLERFGELIASFDGRLWQPSE